MIRGGISEGQIFRSRTVGEAKQCHARMVEAARQGVNFLNCNRRRYKKNWHRLERFWRLCEKRRMAWGEAHQPGDAYAYLKSAPGYPNMPDSGSYIDIFMKWIPTPWQ